MLFSFLILTFLLNSTLVNAEDYYADLEIQVDNAGYVTIKGSTNYPDLLVENSQMYTSKKQSYWLLNISKSQNFSDFVFDVYLPMGSSINYISSSGTIGIQEKSGNLVVSGFGEDEPLWISVQYQIENTSSGNIVNIILIIILVCLILALIVYLLYDRFKTKDNLHFEDNSSEYNFKGLSDRQKEIMKLLIDSEKPLTQAQIQKELDIPKAAVSRNIHSLELKGLIEIEKIGMSNLIRVKKS